MAFVILRGAKDGGEGGIGEEFFIPYRSRGARETKNFSPSLIDCLILIKLNNGFSFDCRTRTRINLDLKTKGTPAFINGPAAIR